MARSPRLKAIEVVSLLASLWAAAFHAGCGSKPDDGDRPISASDSDSGSNVGSNSASTSGSSASAGGNTADGGPACAAAFAPDTPTTYLSKIKNVLIGLPPTDEEVASVTSGGDHALDTLVDTWMTGAQSQTPGGPTFAQLYQSKMLAFFQNAFQQTQITSGSFDNQIGFNYLGMNGRLLQNQEEMFARTILALNAQGAPFNQSISTSTYMMTTALKAFFAFTDAYGLNDPQIAGGPAASPNFDTVAAANPTMTISVTATGKNDPSSGNFVDSTLTFTPSTCTKLEYKVSALVLYGILIGDYPADINGCKGATKSPYGQFTEGDYSDWTMTTLGQPPGGTTAPPFPYYVLQNLRAGGSAASKMTLNRPFVGFFSTPAFFANWQTNNSNQMRVTTNQSLIVALGKQLDGTDTTTPQVDPTQYGLDAVHAAPGSQCITCHWLLDPTREIFAQNFSWYYGYGPRDPEPLVNWFDQPAYFMFQGVQAPMSTLSDFGHQLSQHPLLPSAWAQKLCYYVNSAPCDPDDPEFQEIVQAFSSSSFSWDKLVKAVVTSPITTHVAATTSVTSVNNCGPVSVSRLGHFCAALDARLGFQTLSGAPASLNLCGQDVSLPQPYQGDSYTHFVVSSLPSDGYARGQTIPLLPNQPSLFYRAATEDFCEYMAPLVVDRSSPPAGLTTWSSKGCTSASCPPIGSACTPDAGGTPSCATVGDFVTLVAGLPPSDPRASLLAGALLQHFADASAALGSMGESGTTIPLQSAFVAACMSPSAISIGL